MSSKYWKLWDSRLGFRLVRFTTTLPLQIFVAITCAIFLTQPAIAWSLLERSSGENCSRLNSFISECADPVNWERTFIGNAPEGSLRYAYVVNRQVSQNIIGQITFTEIQDSSNDFHARDLVTRSFEFALETLSTQGNTFQVLSRDEISVFGFQADRSAVFATPNGEPSTTVYTTLINRNTGIQFMTVRMGGNVSHKDYQLHTNFVSKFLMSSGIADQ